MTPEEQAAHLGQKIAYDMFVTMLNPKNRGEAFSWADFPDMVASVAAAHADNGMQQIAADAARRTAKSCLRVSGVASEP